MSDEWLSRFRDDSNRAIAELFSGRADLGSGFRLDIPELLYQTFPPHRDEDRAALDDAVLGWLLCMRDERNAQVDKLGVSAYVKRLIDALMAIQLLDLPHSRKHIRADLDAWLRWLSPLRLAPERDPALECWRVISKDQPSIGCAPSWLRIARDPRPEYFNVAWVALKLLPNGGIARKNQVLMVQAALLHASTTAYYDIATARKSFLRYLSALRGMFPRNPTHWNKVLTDAIDDLIEREKGFVTDVARSLRPKTTKTQHISKKTRSLQTRPDTQGDFERLRNDINVDPSKVGLPKRLIELSRRNLRFAESTGESYYFVRTLLNLGTQLLKDSKFDDVELMELGHLIEHALTWNPDEPYVWGMWSEWFRACDNLTACEWVLREMARLFPDDEYCRVELAKLLINRNPEAWRESVRWLRQAVYRNPDKVHSRVELARILDEHESSEEAKQLLSIVLDRDPLNEVAKKVRTQLSEKKKAPKSIRESNVPDRARVHWDSPLYNELSRRGRLAGEFEDASKTLDRHRSQPTPLIVEYAERGDSLAGFYAQWLVLDSSSKRPPHAWAWNACQLWQKHSQCHEWQKLAHKFPEAAAETAFLSHLVAGDRLGEIEEPPERGSNSPVSNDFGPDRPTTSFIRDHFARLDNITDDQREELAFAVLASRAVGSLEFMGANSQLALNK